MDLISNSINLQKVLHEICTFFMHIFKDDEVPCLPELELLYISCPDESRLKVISFLISAAIDLFASQPTKIIKNLIGDKIGLWRTLVVQICHNHFADKHHLPFEIDIIASRNKLVVESLIFDWPFCNENLSQLLQYLCDAFHGSSHVSQPYIDEYVSVFKSKYKRTEAIRCLILAIKWVHTVQGSPSYEETKNVLKESILNIIILSDVITKNREGQFEEIWNEIVSQLGNYDEFDPSRIDSYPFYCQINPLLKSISDLIRQLFSEENYTDFSKVINGFHDVSEHFESPEVWGLNLTNIILASLNTIMIEVAFRKCRVFPKICENNLKMFINAVALHEPISQVLLISEVNYWVERLKRKKVEIPINCSDYFTGEFINITKESEFLTNLEEYFLKVFQNDSNAEHVPKLSGSFPCIIEIKQFQKMIITCLKSSLNSLSTNDLYYPPISESKMKLLLSIIEQIASHYQIELQTHFPEKIIRILEKFNSSIFRKKESNEIIDNKNFIIPLMDIIDYKKFVTEIWKFVNLSNTFLKPINVQEYLIDLRHDLFSEVPPEQADRIISRIMFFVGWRFRIRSIDISSSEMFRFHMVFNFVSQNLNSKTLIEENLSFWMRKLSSIDYSKVHLKSQTPYPFQMDEFFFIPKLENVKSHVIQVLRGAKNISIPQLTDVPFASYKKGLESTKALLQILRTVFASLNESSCHKHDNVKNWLNHKKALETDLHTICTKLDADRNQVVAELNYLVSFICDTMGDQSNNYKQKFLSNFRETIYLDRDDSDEEMLRSSSSSRYGSIKPEKSSKEKNFMDSDTKFKSKRKFSDMEIDEPKIKQSRMSFYEKDEEDNDYSVKRENRELMKTTLQSKVNFITSCSDLSIGEMIESRITYINEPTFKSICIDPGKGKSRPPRYIQISSCPNRNPINILKKPKLSVHRHKSKVNTNESKTLYNFNIIRQVGNGSLGKIFEAVDKFSNLRVALKRITLDNSEEGVPQCILREIFLYKSLNHSNVIRFVDIVVNEIESIKSKFSKLEMIVPKSFYFVFEYVEHDLLGLFKSKSMIFSMSQIAFLSKQLFSGLAYIHEKNIVHRDITPSNLMITNRGILKLTDFGDARLLAKDVQLDNNLILTPKTVPFLYRAPEILVEMETYGTEVDIWSAGCVICEIFTGSLLWSVDKAKTGNNESVLEHIENIAKIIGSPNAAVWPQVSKCKYYLDLATKGIAINYSRKIDDYMKEIPFDAADVLKQIFQWDPSKRISARTALTSNWLADVEMQTMMPSEFPDKDCHNLVFDNADDSVVSLPDENNQAKVTEVVNDDHFKDSYNLNSQRELSLVVNINNKNQNNCIDNVNGNLNHSHSHSNIDLGNINSMNHNQHSDEDNQNNEDEIKEEDLMKFVDSLSGRILELSDVLDRMRNEPVCTPDIVKGVIMRAARVWSETESIRLRMVKFMLDYLLKTEEKANLGF